MGKGDITTVKLNKKTKERLGKLKVHKRETYDEILQSMLGILNICRTDPEKAQTRLRVLEKRARSVLKNGKEQKE
ncbi:MAG: hypothetical protein ABIG28_02310 [archaeon]